MGEPTPGRAYLTRSLACVRAPGSVTHPPSADNGHLVGSMLGIAPKLSEVPIALFIRQPYSHY